MGRGGCNFEKRSAEGITNYSAIISTIRAPCDVETSFLVNVNFGTRKSLKT